MKRIVAAALTVAALTVPAGASDLTEMSADEREAFRAEVRAYLLENPEVLMEAIAVLEQRQAEAQTMNDAAMIQSNAAALYEDPMSYVGGNPDGDITVVEFLDYRCSYCRRAHPEVKDLISTDGNIRYIVKEFPILGDESVLASRFAIAALQFAGPDAYVLLNDKLMNHRGNFTEQSLVNLANSLDLDGAMIASHMQDGSVTKVIAANHALAQQMQISGTPSFVMGNQMLRGYVPLQGMQQVVAQERSR